MSSVPMYTSIHHDHKTDMVYVWHVDGTRKQYKTKHTLYTPNRGEYGSMPCGMTDIYGKPVYAISVDGTTERELRSQNLGNRNHLSECDIDFRTRFLQNYYKDCDELRFSMNDINICFLDIEVATKGRFPTAELAEYPVNCVTIYFSRTKDYYTFGLNREIKEETNKKLLDNNCTYINCSNEEILLTKLFTIIGINNSDLLVGWNSSRFDNPYLYNRATKLGVNHKLLSRLPPNLASVYIGKQDNELKISATECIDFLLLYKKFTNKERDNYKLDTIGLIEVQERKAPLPDGYQSYIKYWDEFVWYNFKDCELMVKIEAKRRIFESAVAACAEARVPFGAIFEAKKMLVGFIVNYLHKRNIVMPPLRENARETFPGAYVYSTPGYYEDLVSYDYRSMYPSIMMGANISPETKITFPIDYVLSDAEKKLYVRSPWTRNGKVQVYYRRDIVGIVPDVVRVLFDGRTELKKMMKKCKKAGKTDDAVYYDMKQQAYKLFGNSLYGLLGNPYFQFYDIDNSASVTAFGVHLIQVTIKRLVHYFEHDFEKLDKFNEMFGFYPSLDRKLFGSFYTEKEETFEFDEEDENNEEFKGSTVYRRMSHGDTDSFFVKYADIYAPYKSFVGKQVGVVVFDGNKMLSNQSFTIENEQKCKQLFNNMCKEHVSYWNDAEVDVKRRAFSEGILFDGNKRVIYNRYLLTDFCRILDAGIMEDKLSEIMLDYANYWNYKENTLFLKREKCIIQAIVTAKKKYICYVESNEDEKYLDKKTFVLVPNFAITGLEIVRSSSTPFTREHILGLVKDLFKDSDRLVMMERYLAIKKAFYQHVHDKDYYAICIPSGIKTTPPKWDEYVEWPVDKKKSVDWRGRAGAVWNYLIENDPVLSKISLEPVFESSKVKFIKVRPNQYGLKSIAFVGDACPERLLELFTPDWDEQWVKGFAQTMDRLFTAVYGSKNFEKDQREQMCDML